MGFVPTTTPAASAATTACQPKVVRLKRRNAPKRAPCPHCGQRGRRKQVLQRTVRDLAYQAIVLVEVTTAEYRATCACCTTFRTQVEGVAPKAQYTNRVRDAVLDRLLDDHLNVEQIQQALRRDFLLELSDGFLYDCLDWQIRQVEGAAYRQWSLQAFSGTLCIDEIHLGAHTLLLATDPLSDFPVAFALVASNDQDHMGRFLRNLQAHGFQPWVVVTDGSNLYPKLLALIWPLAEHQLCVFHVLKELNRCVLDAVRRLGRRLRQRGRRGRRRQRGRPRRPRPGGPPLKERAHFVFKHRYLVVKRRDHFTARDEARLALLLDYLPELRTLRQFVDEIYGLFEKWQTPEQARRRHQRLLGQAAYAADPHLAEALKMLAPAKFEKMIAFLRSPVGQRTRTNNHVERSNRQLRYWEKVRYKWRRRRTIVRFVLLALHRQWHQRPAPPGSRPRRPAGQQSSQRLHHGAVAVVAEPALPEPSPHRQAG